MNPETRARILSSRRFQSHEARLRAALRAIDDGWSVESQAEYWAVSVGDLQAELTRREARKRQAESETPSLFENLP